MLMNYPISQWIELGQYSLFVLALFTATGLLSCKLSSIYFPMQEKASNRVKKDIRQKKIFHDVA